MRRSRDEWGDGNYTFTGAAKRHQHFDCAMSTPELHVQTMFSLDGNGRIVGTREPDPSPGPLFSLVRGRDGCAWAVRSDVPRSVAKELGTLAGEEPSVADFRVAPVHAEQYASLVEGRVDYGPAFTFPEEIVESNGTVLVEDIKHLDRHFAGWRASEIPYRIPIVALIEDGHAVSVCFCARRSDVAAEAEVETAVAYRGRGFAPRVTAAWAMAIRASGRVPLYSTSWNNSASLSVAGKLGLVSYACSWSIS